MDILTPIVSGGLALLGGWLGSTLSARREREARRFGFVKQQLEEFYGPFHALQQEIAAKSKLRPRITLAGNDELMRIVAAVEDPEEKERLYQQEAPKYQAIASYNNEQLQRELLPLYTRLLTLFREKMWLAEPSTRTQYHTLVDFVELWERWTANTLPIAVAKRLGIDDSRAQPLYNDVTREMEKLRLRLREKGR